MENEIKRLKKELENAQSEVQRLKTQLSPSESSPRHSEAFWDDIEYKLRNNTDEIKALIKNGTISMSDTDKSGNTLLHKAAWKGNYEVAQLCINLGADIHKKNRSAKTPLSWAVENNGDHIAQLLLFASTKSNVGDRIKNISHSILKQQSIIENVMNELSLIGEQSKDIFIKSLQEITMNLITKKLVFSDDLLNLCWIIEQENGDPLQSELWETIERVCKEIINGKSKRDWFWLKQCLLPSNIWYQKAGKEGAKSKTEENKDDEKTKKEDKQQEQRELHYKLLNLVNIQDKIGLNDLQKDLNALADENKEDWNALITWDIPDKYGVMRQDSIPGGLKSRYSHHQLLQRTTAKFDSIKFYDYNQYLAELVLLAQIVDDEFQKSVQSIFNIDRITNIGCIKNDDEKEIDNNINIIKYMKGPVKLVERARAKAANDYSDRAYPTSSCVLDLNRCCLVFNNIKTMLTAIKLFENKIHHYQSGNIIDIVRDKNGFIDYVRDGVQYADIKLNVLIRGETNNIIGEVQFLLSKMKEFKDRAHNLYAIQREEEFVSGAVKNVLPMLLDTEKQINIAVLNNDSKKICNVMIFGNKSNNDIVCIDKEQNQSILQRVCIAGSIKIFKFIQSLMTEDELLERLFLRNGVYNQTPIEEAIQLQRHKLAEYILSLQCVQNKLKQKDEEDYDNIIWRLILWICVQGNEKIFDYFKILNSLGITNDDITNYFKYKYRKTTQIFLSSGHWKYWEQRIVHRIFEVQGYVNTCQSLLSFIDESVLSENILAFSPINHNAITLAIWYNRVNVLKYIFETFPGVKEKCVNDINTRWTLLYFMYKKYDNCGDVRSYLMEELEFTKESLTEIVSYKYLKPTDLSYLISGHWQYWNYQIAQDAIQKLFN